jgi:amino acid adenylation domain-containing protein
MSEYLVQHFLDNASAVYPQRTAVVSPRSALLYRSLYESSNRLAHWLMANGVGRQGRVALSLGRSPEILVAMMGTLKADAIYVPIDPKAPAERCRKILVDCRPSALICDAGTCSTLAAHAHDIRLRVPVIVLGTPAADRPDGVSFPAADQRHVDAQTPDAPDYRNVDTDIAYILYTSGSTGNPKGVMISHLNIMNYISWAAKRFQISIDDVILNTAPFHFDMSTYDIFCALRSGSCLAIAPENYMLFPTKLVRFIESQGVTLWKGVSSLLSYMARAGSLRPGAMPTLKKVLFAGEVLPTKYLIEWMRCFPEKEFFNGYGPTEATGMSMYYRVPSVPSDAREAIPIGKACSNTEVFLLDPGGGFVSQGEVGELCIRGSGVSPGYWNDPEKTAQAFITNPRTGYAADIVYRTGDLALLRQDGNYEFIGRRDSQVKWMGYRIELGELESALASLECVKEAAALFLEDDEPGRGGLVAFVEADGESDESKILSQLRPCVPHYMMPRRIICMSSLPRNDRGKVDRMRLKDLPISSSMARVTGNPADRGPAWRVSP